MNAPTSPSHVITSDHRYLTFSIAGETYGVRVCGVQEIIRIPPVTHVPQLPAHIRGVFNLRGRVIPVIDVRQRFGLPPAVDHDRTCVVVVQVETAHRGVLHMGLVVDAVNEVRQIAADDIAATPDFGCRVDTDFLLGMAKVNGAVHALLDLHRVLTGEQLDALASAIAPAA